MTQNMISFKKISPETYIQNILGAVPFYTKTKILNNQNFSLELNMLTPLTTTAKLKRFPKPDSGYDQGKVRNHLVGQKPLSGSVSL